MGFDLSAAMNSSTKENKSKPKSSNNPYLADMQKGLKLITTLVSAKTDRDKTDKVLDEIYNMIHEEFFELLRNDISPKSAQAYKGLVDTYQDLVEICFFPAIENKHIVAVGGHFSAGKSKFLNSIVGDKNLLPIDQTPTTSIPTYILKGKTDAIYALNQYQNKVKIDNDALKVIAHEFNRIYNLSFSHLLKLVTVERENFLYDNVLFIDTPGYSKADTVKTRHSNTDENIAREHLRSADLLIWLIDIKSGTITNDDIEFVKSLNMDKPILFVLNKADMKMESDIQKVVKAVRDSLEKEQITVYDVVGYSSNLTKEYSASGNVIKTFMNEINTIKPGTDILLKFENVFNDFLSYHHSQKELVRSTRKIINESLFDAEMTAETRQSLSSITNRFKKQVDDLIGNEKAIDDFYKRLDEKVIEALTLQNIRITTGANIKFNTKEGSSQKKKQRLRFAAMIGNEIKNYKDNLVDMNSIPGRVVKVSSTLVKIIALNKIDVIVSNTEIKKQTGLKANELFREEMQVNIQYTGKSSCVVEADFIL